MHNGASNRLRDIESVNKSNPVSLSHIRYLLIAVGIERSPLYIGGTVTTPIVLNPFPVALDERLTPFENRWETNDKKTDLLWRLCSLEILRNSIKRRRIDL